MKRVLITNNTLGPRAGSEMYVRDLAFGLLKAGWQPMAFSTELGAVADELRALTIPVVSDLASLPFRPDIIHAHHHLDAMAAIQHFPGVPVIYYCHGWLPWEEAPLRHPQIFRYVAVDALCRERLVVENAIPESQVEVLLNFVDLQRFRPRAPLPPRPQRALVFGNLLGPGQHIYEAIRSACAAQGIHLEVAGRAGGSPSSQPENQLPEFDLVFAKARCAMEAMAVGCAVIVCDAYGMGGMVTPETYDELRPLNFGLRTLRKNPAPTARDIADEIALYDPAQCQQVAERLRAEGDVALVLQRLIAIYEEAIARAPATAIPTPDPAARATAEYLLFLARETKEIRRALAALAPCQQLTESQAAQLAALRTELAARDAELAVVKAENLALQSEGAALSAENANRQSERASLQLELAALQLRARELDTKLRRYRGLRRLLPRWLAERWS